MKTKFCLFAFILMAILISSCDSSIENDMLPESDISFDNASTRAISSDSLQLDSVVPLEETEELKALREYFEKQRKNRASALAYGNYDQNLSTNMWNIRELPIKIEARGKGNTNSTFLSSNGLGKEITLTTSNRTTNQRFYLKILPASSGIPYLIYSKQTETPLSVGQYESNPNNKVLFARGDNSGTLYSAGWDLIPSESYKGYFAIQSESYLGQSDPNNWWSVFNHVLEVKNDNKIGYGQYTKKAQQEFLIKPADKFELREIVFDINSATVSEREPQKVVTYGENRSEDGRKFDLTPTYNTFETSCFYERSALKVDMSNSTTKHRRPSVSAGKFVPPTTINPNEEPDPTLPPADALYTSTTQRIDKTLQFKVSGWAKPNCLIEITSYLRNYSISATYTAKFRFDDREVLCTGTWSGTYYTTIKSQADIIKCFDLDDGEELRRLGKIFITPTELK